MKINVAQIIEGWRNKLIPPAHLKEMINEVSKERTDICNSCMFHSSNREKYRTMRVDDHCTLCGCTLSAKTKCLSCSCPLNPPKWEAVVSEDDEEEINNDREITN